MLSVLILRNFCLTGTQSIDMADHVTVADGGEKMSEHVVRCLRVTGALCATGRIGRRLANTSPCLIGIEAGMATHYVARELLALGHDVRQVPPAYAKPFRQGHKNGRIRNCGSSAAAIDTLRSGKD